MVLTGCNCLRMGSNGGLL